MPYLIKIGKNVNSRLQEALSLASGMVFARTTFDRLQQPLKKEGKQSPAIPFGRGRMMKVMEAICQLSWLADGFSNKEMRTLKTGLTAQGEESYKSFQATYDLRKLISRGILQRIPGTCCYLITPMGYKIAAFYTVAYHRLFYPVLAGLSFQGAVSNHYQSSWDKAYGKLSKAMDHMVASIHLIPA